MYFSRWNSMWSISHCRCAVYELSSHGKVLWPLSFSNYGAFNPNNICHLSPERQCINPFIDETSGIYEGCFIKMEERRMSLLFISTNLYYSALDQRTLKLDYLENGQTLTTYQNKFALIFIFICQPHSRFDDSDVGCVFLKQPFHGSMDP